MANKKINWQPIGELPKENGFYLITYAFKLDPSIRIARMAEFNVLLEEFQPMLVEAYLYDVKKGLAKDWKAIAWAKEPEPFSGEF